MITDPQFPPARALLNRSTAPLAEASGPSEVTILCADQADGASDMKANKLEKLQRLVEAAAMVSIDG